MKLAYTVAAFHAVVIILLLFCSVWIWLNPQYSGVFLIFLFLFFSSWPFFKGCPLTWLENKRRSKVGPEMTYPGQCLVFYGRRLGINVPRRTPIVILAIMIANAILLFVRNVLR